MVCAGPGAVCQLDSVSAAPAELLVLHESGLLAGSQDLKQFLLFY